MIPFCRTPEEADRVLAVMAEAGLARGQAGLEVYVMCEIPANVIRADDFAERFDGFSIGSNDLTQLTLGVDRDSDRLAALFDESDPAVIWMIQHGDRKGPRGGAQDRAVRAGALERPGLREGAGGCRDRLDFRYAGQFCRRESAGRQGRG